jgi:hypothetical protein
MGPSSRPKVAATAPPGSSHVQEPQTSSSHPRETNTFPTLKESYSRNHKSNSEHTTEKGELKVHSDLWFEDGSVVLRAENTLFKVHISQLSRHSAFFRDMFSLPQPKPTTIGESSCTSSPLTSNGDGNEKDNLWDGCPLVYLHDKAEDVGNLLTALYDGPYVVLYSESALRILIAHVYFFYHTLQEFRQQRPGRFPNSIWYPTAVYEIPHRFTSCEGIGAS